MVQSDRMSAFGTKRTSRLPPLVGHGRFELLVMDRTDLLCDFDPDQGKRGSGKALIGFSNQIDTFSPGRADFHKRIESLRSSR
jgi:hypothetical protein